MSLFSGSARPPIPTEEESSEYSEGTLGIWSTYYDQADPLVIYRDGGWNNLTIDSLRELLKQ